MPLVLGADIGGTRTRVALLRIPRPGRRGSQRELRIEAYAEAPGGNFRSDPDGAIRNITDCLSQLRGTTRTITSACFGVAGAGAAGLEATQRLVRQGLDDARFDYDSQGVEVVTDIDIAFASTGLHRNGLLVLSGTGAVSARIDDGLVTHRCDGMGWILGDEGSAIWIARRCLEAVAADVDGRGPRTSLTNTFFRALGLLEFDSSGDRSAYSSFDSPSQQLIAAVHSRTVPEIATLAKYVEPALHSLDPVASGIVREAATALVRNARTAWAPMHLDEPLVAPEVVVLAGGVLLNLTRLRAQVEAGLLGHFGMNVRFESASIPLLGALHRAAHLSASPVDHEDLSAAYQAGTVADQKQVV